MKPGDIIKVQGGDLWMVDELVDPGQGVLRARMVGRPAMVRSVKARQVEGHWRKTTRRSES